MESFAKEIKEPVFTLEESNYVLKKGECEVPVKGQKDEFMPQITAHLGLHGEINIYDTYDTQFCIKLKIPNEYIKNEHRRVQSEEDYKKQKYQNYLKLKKEFE
jgi:hypothetical protein